MSNKKSSPLVPTLRFPEFREAGEWVEKMLGSVCKSFSGGTPATSQKEFYGGNIPFIRSAEIDKKNTELLLTNAGLNNSSAKLINKGDVLVALYGANSGNVAIARIDGAINQAILCLKSEGSNEFIYQFLSFRKNSIIARYIQGGQGNLSGEIVKSIIFPFPKLEEQQKIAACLSSLDELITAHSQKLDALKKHKKGLMQQLFPAEGQTVPTLRFPEFREAGEWVVVKIGDFVESYKGGAPLTPSDFVSYSDYEVIPKKAIDEGMYLNMNIEKPTYCKGSFYNKNLQSVVDSTYLITTLRDLVPSGPNIGYIVKYESERKYILAQGVYGIKPNKKIISDFLIQFSKTDKYRKMMQSVMVGTTQVHIRNSVYFNLPISVPTLPEQQKIAACLSSLDELISAQSQKLDALKKHKKGLMQQLFPAY